MSPDDLQQLVAPIALYPDALLAQVMAAATYPNEVVAAAQWEDAGGKPEDIDAQPWDSSVKGVARYSNVLHYMASNGDWMNTLGSAFLNQQRDAMNAVQTLRAKAITAGTLFTNQQQTVINQDGIIQIIPTNPQMLYAPQYDAQNVYSAPQYNPGDNYTPLITYGPGVSVGDWLGFDFDWYGGGVYFGNWGADRPWWHDHDARYLDDRPGLYQPGKFKDAGGHAIDAKADHWTHDAHQPLPRAVNRPVPAHASPGSERGYEAAPGRAANMPGYGGGGDVNRQSERGRQSRQGTPSDARQAPAPARPAPEPARSAPEPARSAPEPVRSAPQSGTGAAHSAPSAQARPAAPTGGGAMGGYQNSADAARASGRGAQSRGGGGGAPSGGGHAGGGAPAGGGGAAHGGGGGGGGGGGHH